jgi:mono/diheme cytochrome c family protein
MWAVRVYATLLAAGLTLSPSLLAQTAPDINLPPGDAVRGKAIFEGSKGNCQSCHRVGGVGSLFGPDLSTVAAPPRGGGGGRGGGGANAAGGRGGAAAGAAPAAGARGAVPAFGGDEVANARNAADAAAVAAARGAQGAAPAPAPTLQQQLAQSILDPNAIVSVQNRYVLLTMKDGKTISGKLLSVDTFAYQILDSNERLANISKTDVRRESMTSPMASYRGKLTDQELSDVISYLMTLKGQ